MSVNTLDADQVDAFLTRNHQVQLVDVLPPEQYETFHLPDSLNGPVRQLKNRAADELNFDDPVVVYCTGPDCRKSAKAARLLDE